VVSAEVAPFSTLPTSANNYSCEFVIAPSHKLLTLKVLGMTLGAFEFHNSIRKNIFGSHFMNIILLIIIYICIYMEKYI
jgi:hypothetical protein